MFAFSAVVAKSNFIDMLCVLAINIAFNVINLSRDISKTYQEPAYRRTGIEFWIINLLINGN